ncbi:MAG TPA: DUF3575 domain-containing protein [Cyclobacteriaceae bacterium]|nr:DUF3575 domain-containing protein [Cyclobacteriaceae bacterium]
MKRPRNKVLLMAFVLTAFALSANAQGSVIKLNIFSPIVSTFNVQYEKTTKADQSFQLGFFYSGYSSSDTKFNGFGITPEYRFYLSDTDAPQGVYMAPFLRYQSFNASNASTNTKGSLTSFGGGVILGKQWIFKEHISLDIFIGPSYYSSNVKIESGSPTIDATPFDGFTVRAGVCFGYAF